MNKLSLLVSVCALVFSTQSFAGTANATIQCDGSGASLSGSVPGDEADYDVTVKMNGKSARVYSVTDGMTGNTKSTGDISVVQDLPAGVYTLITYRKEGYGFVQMYALPKTVVYKSMKNGYVTTFEAKISFNLNEIANDSQYPTVKCTMKYAL